ncbi:hypothetical protein DL96DRAFT_1009324 [Flagelloscypha sp. PMI_526]|nr:hypothetical protein DL96DRAFT_1009324 [Flagelloscypha sp. PMI_526]
MTIMQDQSDLPERPIPRFPPELEELIFKISAQVLPSESHLNLMLVSHVAYFSVSKIAYHTLKVVSPLQFSKLNALLKSEVSGPFSNSVRAICIWLNTLPTELDFSLFWKVLLPSLPNIVHIATWCSSWPPLDAAEKAAETQAAFRAIMSLPRLTHLRLDWKLNSMLPTASDYAISGAITHLTLICFPDIHPEHLAPFISVSHLLILTCGDWRSSEFDNKISVVLRTLPSLEYLLLWDSSMSGTMRPEHSDHDPRIVYDFDGEWDNSSFIEKFEKGVNGDEDSFWGRAEKVVNERRMISLS